MIIATGPAGVSSYTQIVQTSNRLYFNGATTDSVHDSKFAGKTYINELNFGTAPQLSTVAISGAYADLTGKPSLATVATSGLFTDLSSKPSGTAPLSYNSGTNSFNISQATTSTNGYLSSTDWNTFNNKYLLPSGGTTLQYVRGDGTIATFPTTLDSTRLIFTGKNTTGATLTKGTVVYVNGASGNLPLLAKALASQDSTSAQTLGLVQSDILNNQSGVVVLIGSITDIDTSLIIEGSQLYLSGTVAGGYTTTKYLAPTHLVYVGIVTRSHPTQGVIEVKIQNGYELDEIHDVQIISPANKDVLYRDSATSLWKHAGISTILGYTPYNGTNTSIKALFSASAPLSYSDGVFSISQATTSSNGYLSSTDWNTFNGKESALTFSAPLVRTTNAISITQASASTSGFLSSTDWNTFNNKSSTNGTVTSVAMSVPTGLSISGTPITTSGTLALSFSAGYSLPSDATQATWTAKQAALNGTGFVKATGTTISYDNTSYLPLTGGVVSGSIGFSDSGKRGIYGSMGVNDNWFIGAVAFTTDNGFVEIATGDDGNEPIYVRQYNGDPYTTGTVARTATILDGSGNTTFPNTLTATTLVKSGGSSTQFLKADGSVDNSTYLTTASAASTYQTILTNPVTGTGTINTIAYWSSSSAIGALALATYPSLTELAYVKGVTSSIQTQLNAKQATLTNPVTGTGTTNYHTKWTSSSSIGNSLIFDNGTNLGIATSGSTYASTTLLLRATSATSTNYAFIVEDNATNELFSIQNSGALTIKNAGTTRLTIASTGAATFSSTVGIGNAISAWSTGTFPKVLQVGNASLVTNGTAFAQLTNNMYFDGSAYRYITSNGASRIILESDGVITFNNAVSGTAGNTVSTTERMRITSAGNVGIGTSSPEAYTNYNTLTVDGTSGSILAMRVNGTLNYRIGTNSGEAYLLTTTALPLTFYTNSTERMRITSGGNILMGTTTDNGERLYVSGAIRATGNITANSDLTLKKNLKLIDNPIDKLMQLNGYAYQWKANDEHQYGVIAQEVEKILPYAVSTGNDGIKGVSYNQLTPLLIEGFKSHESEITILKARVKYLESKLA
jgi:hypothetical protein